MEEIRRRYISLNALLEILQIYVCLLCGDFSYLAILMHSRLVFFPMKRAGADDKPLRMVKTVLHELVKLRGAAIKGHLSLVPIDMRPQPIILAYIDLNLEVRPP